MRPSPLFALFAAALLAPISHAAVTLPPVFSEHMVLQRSAVTPIWGNAAPGEKIALSLGTDDASSIHYSTTAGQDGRWRIDLDLSDNSRVPEGPHQLVIRADNTLIIPDVLVGEVWLASGQSNMARRMSASGSAEEIATSANNRIRFFTVSTKATQSPVANIPGKWVVAGPGTTRGFSAVAYYFASQLQAGLDVPFGVIHSSVGGTPVEAWTSLEALKASPEIAPGALAAIEAFDNFSVTKADWLARLKPWLAANRREDRPTPAADLPAYTALPAADGTDGWSQVRLPSKLPGERILWVRRDVAVSPAEAGKPLVIDIDEIVGIDTVYFAGKPVGGRTLETFDGDGRSRLNSRRRYRVPADDVAAGTHTLAVRIYAPLGESGINAGYFAAGSQSLSGDWLVKTEYEFPPLSPEGAASRPEPLKAPLRPWNIPASLYNGMIDALVPYGLRGFIWYQGESDAGKPRRYRAAFPLLIQDWRSRWTGTGTASSGVPHSFYWCQLPNFQAKPTDANGSPGWAGIREAQSHALTLPRTGQAVLIDAGEGGDVHPQSKREAGARLAALALAHDYARPVEYSGPVFDSLTVEGPAIRIHFKHVGGGLVARPVPSEHLWKSVPKRILRPVVRHSPDSELEGFTVRGADGKWHWADARIDGDTVVVSSPAVPKPKDVRHAWFSNPTVNLYNAAGLPAAPFRTDAD